MNVPKRLALVLGLAAACGAAPAMAHGNDELRWSVTIGTPVGVPAVAAPVYTAPVYSSPVYTAPAPVVVTNRPWRDAPRWDRDRDGIPDRVDRRYTPPWDRDGDGIPDRHERIDNRHADRDRDGIPDRFDRRYTPPWDRDGDGIPNRRDPSPGRPGWR